MVSTPNINFARFFEFGRKIVGIGRNYREHAKELGNPVPAKPIIFLKPNSSVILEGKTIMIPKGCSSLHHEIELGVVIGKGGKDIREESAMEHVAGYVLALDMTARDFQQEAKEKGLPWTMAKGFDTSCPISKFIPKEQLPDPYNIELWLAVNSVQKQCGSPKDMIVPISSLISFISNYLTLEPNDLILTGTPAGVGPVTAGDTIEGRIMQNSETVLSMSFPVAQKI